MYAIEHRPHSLSPEDHPLLDAPVVAPPTGPLSEPGALEERLRDYRRQGLTDAEALTWLLAHDLGLPHREVARARGISRRTSEKTLSRARLKLGYSYTDEEPH